MGKRKSARKPVKKVQARLERQFDCHFCNHEKTVECKLDRENSTGFLQCRFCGVSWKTNIHSLSEPVDIYCDWIDACEQVKESAIDRNTANSAMRSSVASSIPSQRVNQSQSITRQSHNSTGVSSASSRKSAITSAAESRPVKKKASNNNLDDFIDDSEEEEDSEDDDSSQPSDDESEEEDDLSDNDKVVETTISKKRIVQGETSSPKRKLSKDSVADEFATEDESETDRVEAEKKRRRQEQVILSDSEEE